MVFPRIFSLTVALFTITDNTQTHNSTYKRYNTDSNSVPHLQSSTRDMTSHMTSRNVHAFVMLTGKCCPLFVSVLCCCCCNGVEGRWDSRWVCCLHFLFTFMCIRHECKQSSSSSTAPTWAHHPLFLTKSGIRELTDDEKDE